MKRFDCLSLDCPVLGLHLLEASAGTGKTFAIEHVFVRLLLESIELEKILAVTFTRAATRELKERIRGNIEKALSFLRGEDASPWDYLLPLIGNIEAIRNLNDALKGFDRCQIFTIHGFCFRILQEFAFEAGLGFSLLDPDKVNGASKKIRESARTFLIEGLDETLLCPEQISLLFSKYETTDDLIAALLRSPKIEATSFSLLEQQFVMIMQSWKGERITEEYLREEFIKIRGQFRAMKGDFEEQITSLADRSFRKLISARGSLFSFLSIENRKLKTKETAVSSFFSWAEEQIAPLVWAASDRKKIFATLSSGWKKWEEKYLVQEGLIQPDEILSQMRTAIDREIFTEQIQRRFQAVIIDEFQDTDPLQWDIFRKTFLEKKTLSALYLVGDPKQSIYRFRNADVYTYFAAREFLGDDNLYQLDTNFRSSKELISALNVLFSSPFLPLPKTKSMIPYVPVYAGSSITPDIQDQKKSIHWLIGDEESSFEEVFLPYAASEIKKLNPETSIAVLVKDRYQMSQASEYFRNCQIPFIARSHETLGETVAFQSIRELLDALASPYDETLKNIVQQGPFKIDDGMFFFWKDFLIEKGLVLFFHAFLKTQVIPFEQDLEQILEALFAWEQREGFSFEGLTRFINAFEKLGAEEGGRRKVDGSEDAVQILTLHVSKGLEFDIVFALGLFAEPPKSDKEEEEELNAEKLRQLYVAMTRAKRRLYVPVQTIAFESSSSPMALFCRNLEQAKGPFIPYLEQLAQSEEISFERIKKCIPKWVEIQNQFLNHVRYIEPLKRTEYVPSFIQSFTSLARAIPNVIQEIIHENSLQEPAFPGGKDTGTIVHRIFEEIFSSSNAAWREDRWIDQVVEKELRFTSLVPWLDPICKMVKGALHLPLLDGAQTFCLKDLKPEEICIEMEFLYEQKPHFVKGFIDLVFWHQGKLYIVDWKTNILSDTSFESMQKAMLGHNYTLQASLYAEALKRHLGSSVSFDEVFGGAFYLFIRHGVYYHVGAVV